MQGGEQGTLIRGHEARPRGSVVLRLKAESLEPLMKEDGRGGKGLDVVQPATGARESREFVKRGDELLSEFQPKRDG